MARCASTRRRRPLRIRSSISVGRQYDGQANHFRGSDSGATTAARTPATIRPARAWRAWCPCRESPGRPGPSGPVRCCVAGGRRRRSPPTDRAMIAPERSRGARSVRSSRPGSRPISRRRSSKLGWARPRPGGPAVGAGLGPAACRRAISARAMGSISRASASADEQVLAPVDRGDQVSPGRPARRTRATWWRASSRSHGPRPDRAPPGRPRTGWAARSPGSG